MIAKRRLITCLGLGLGAAGCQGGFLGLGGDREADFRTDRAQYTLTATSGGLETSISFTYTNRTGRRIHVLNCNRIAPPHLEKRVGDTWAFAWGMATPDCVSVPIPIPYLATYRDTLPVFHGLGAVHPKFETAPLDGTYRLVWDAIRWNNDGSLFSIGDTLPLALRVSNTFRIVTPG
jgi:hypothetical protein